MARVSILTTALLIGCSAHDGGDGMVVLENTAATGSVCAFTGDPAQPTLSSGQINNQSTGPYLLTPLLESRIVSLGSDDDIGRTILLTGADVTLQEADSSGNLQSLGPTFTAEVSGSLPPMAEANVSIAIVPVSVINTITTNTELVAKIVVHGTEGGGNIDAEPFSYGVTVCTDCIVNLIEGSGANPKVNSCSGLTAVVRAGNPCNPYQDGVVDCCTSGPSGTTLVCPAVAD